MSQDLPARTRLTLAAQNRSVVSIAITSSDADDHFAIGREDYTKETMAVAQAQALGVTEEGKSRYGLTIGGSIKSLQVNGYPASIEDGGPGGRNTFSDEFNDPSAAPALSAFENASNSQTLGFNIIKGKALPASELDVDYQEFLREVASNPSDNRLAVSLTKLAEENNGGFTSKTPYLTIGQKEKDTTIGKVVLQNEPGVHAPKTFPETRTTVEMKMQTLKNLGLQLMLKASGEYVNMTDQEDFAQTLAVKAGSLAPGLARIGVKIPLVELQPKNLILQSNPDFTKTDSSLLRQDDTLTNGSYNSPLVPFDGIDTRSIIAASVILISTLGLLFETLSRVFSPRNGLQSQLANSITSQVNNLTIQTTNDYTECVRVGMLVFFGNGSSNSIADLIQSGFSKLQDSPGYYNTILRNLVKSLTYEVGQSLFAAAVPPGVIDGLAGPLDSNSGATIRPAGLSQDIGGNLFKAFSRISQSRIVAFMNVLANLGDLQISLRDQAGMLEAGGRVTSLDAQISDVSGEGAKEIVNPSALIRRNRLSSAAQQKLGFANLGPLAWGSSTTPSVFILPRSIIQAANDLDGSGTTLETRFSSDPSIRIQTDERSRIAPEVVQEIEDNLEASYVPFYFHDLRTNEIISFHAFLTEMSDGFTAEYSETSGYGRVGKIFTYKNTDRSISMGFMVVATSDADFQRMWWKINKLVTTVYPQYTAGRTIEYQGEKFIQPFSQLPSASPLVRIRLGDVWKSNYSKFALARLFGLGQGQDKFSLNQSNIDTERTNNEQLREKISLVRARMARNDFSVNERFYFQYTAPSAAGRRARRGVDAMPLGAPESSYVLHMVATEGVTGTPTPSPAGSRTGGRAASATQPSPTLTSGRYLMRVVSKEPGTGSSQDTGQAQTTSDTILYKLRIDDASSGDRSREYYLRLPTTPSATEVQPHEVAHVTIYEDDVQAAATQLQGQTSTTEIQDEENTTSLVQNFFISKGDNQNPIFKAFETTAGRGLAGFIRSIKFDWAESTWSVDGFNGRAPQMLKIAIEFAPIHDIAPGIDNNGFNTAPVYRVGELSDALNTTTHRDKTENDARRTRWNTLNGESALRRNPSSFRRSVGGGPEGNG